MSDLRVLMADDHRREIEKARSALEDVGHSRMGRDVRLFFHHVGQKGADEDFKKTVYKDIGIETVESNIPSSDPLRDEM